MVCPQIRTRGKDLSVVTLFQGDPSKQKREGVGSVIQRRKKEATRSIIELVPAVATGFNSSGDSLRNCVECVSELSLQRIRGWALILVLLECSTCELREGP